jgi:four helix bundle protein
MNTYQDLQVWQIAIDLVVDIYALTKYLPESERYGLISQLHRAAISIPSNIAEGKGRSSAKLFKHYLEIARGSIQELETQIFICMRLGYISNNHFQEINGKTEVIHKMLNALIKSIKLKSSIEA